MQICTHSCHQFVSSVASQQSADQPSDFGARDEQTAFKARHVRKLKSTTHINIIIVQLVFQGLLTHVWRLVQLLDEEELAPVEGGRSRAIGDHVAERDDDHEGTAQEVLPRAAPARLQFS